MGKRIMVIDDDKDFLNEMQEFLVLSDYEVFPVENPIYAIDEAIRVKPDLILLDLKMPEENGFQIASKIRNFSVLKRIPIIVVTGSLNNDYRAAIKRSGIRSLLTKPFDPMNLILEMEKVL